MTEEFDNLIVLTDEEGTETTWEHIGTFNVGDNCYVAMLSLDGDCDCEGDDDCDCESEGEVWLMKLVTDENGDQAFALIEDEAEYDAAAEEYTRIFDEGGFDLESEEEE